MITSFLSPKHALSFVSVVGSHAKLKELVQNGFLAQSAYDQIKEYAEESRSHYITLASFNDGDHMYETVLLVPDSSVEISNWVKQLQINVSTAYSILIPLTDDVIEVLRSDIKAKLEEVICYHLRNNHVLTSIYNILNMEG